MSKLAEWEVAILPLKKYYEMRRQQLIKPHQTDCCQIIWFLEGTATHKVDFQQLSVGAGSMLFLKEGMVQQFDTQGDLDGLIIQFSEKFYDLHSLEEDRLKNNVLFDETHPPSSLIPESFTPFKKILEILSLELKKPDGESDLNIINHLLKLFVLEASREYGKTQDLVIQETSSYLATYQKFRDAVNDHFRDVKTVADYATQLSTIEKRLTRATNAIAGKSPKQIIDERIVLEIKRLLATSSLQVKDVGQALGFDEPTNFVKYFKKHCGCSPSMFREQFL